MDGAVNRRERRGCSWVFCGEVRKEEEKRAAGVRRLKSTGEDKEYKDESVQLFHRLLLVVFVAGDDEFFQREWSREEGEKRVSSRDAVSGEGKKREGGRSSDNMRRR
ncbi:hypothetical protein HAX54_041746 [Datura stramonium]|uniref:Uncharacterized protein n=1 Tax=Datura stramonium TaxID=4076 RepID=A0ABS8SLV4_DATST|nr:hypothetical protein [Datura stramonium]